MNEDKWAKRNGWQDRLASKDRLIKAIENGLFLTEEMYDADGFVRPQFRELAAKGYKKRFAIFIASIDK